MGTDVGQKRSGLGRHRREKQEAERGAMRDAGAYVASLAVLYLFPCFVAGHAVRGAAFFKAG
jgi:hypothetical protein